MTPLLSSIENVHAHILSQGCELQIQKKIFTTHIYVWNPQDLQTPVDFNKLFQLKPGINPPVYKFSTFLFKNLHSKRTFTFLASAPQVPSLFEITSKSITKSFLTHCFFYKEVTVLEVGTIKNFLKKNNLPKQRTSLYFKLTAARMINMLLAPLNEKVKDVFQEYCADFNEIMQQAYESADFSLFKIFLVERPLDKTFVKRIEKDYKRGSIFAINLLSHVIFHNISLHSTLLTSGTSRQEILKIAALLGLKRGINDAVESIYKNDDKLTYEKQKNALLPIIQMENSLALKAFFMLLTPDEKSDPSNIFRMEERSNKYCRKVTKFLVRDYYKEPKDQNGLIDHLFSRAKNKDEKALEFLADYYVHGRLGSYICNESKEKRKENFYQLKSINPDLWCVLYCLDLENQNPFFTFNNDADRVESFIRHAGENKIIWISIQDFSFIDCLQKKDKINFLYKASLMGNRLAIKKLLELNPDLSQQQKALLALIFPQPKFDKPGSLYSIAHLFNKLGEAHIKV